MRNRRIKINLPVGIDKNVPMPIRSTRRVRKSKYPFRRMQVGDSFAVFDVNKKGSISGIGRMMRLQGVGTFQTLIVTEQGKELVRTWRTK